MGGAAEEEKLDDRSGFGVRRGFGLCAQMGRDCQTADSERSDPQEIPTGKQIEGSAVFLVMFVMLAVIHGL